VRFESRVGPRTRIEVLTEGILTRRMQHDPHLDGVGLVIFDEFHERSIHADLGLALCREIQGALRPDMRVLVMSATLDAAAIAKTLAAPVITAEGRHHPVQVSYALRDVEPPIHQTVADAVLRALAGTRGDVLVFLPGVGEINRVHDLLQPHAQDVALHMLHGEQPLDAQQAALVPDDAGRRKVVLATSIAETSLTIEGVGVVIDSGLARVPRFDSGTGLTALETVRVTRDSAEQRAGRAGRLGPGVCMRLWTEATQARLVPARRPEILESDLAALRLELAQWGMRDVNAAGWITPPPPGAFAQAEALLRDLGAIDSQGLLTPRGAKMVDLPTHPRLAHMLIEARDARDAALAPLACDVAALLDDRDVLGRDSGADLTLRVETLRRWRATGRAGRDARGFARAGRAAAQWRRELRVQADDSSPNPHDVGWLVMQAYPERIAQQRAAGSAKYRLANGRGAALREGDPLMHEPWLAVAHLDASGAEGRIQLAAPLHVQDVLPLAREYDVAGWDAKQGVLLARRERRVGELVIESKPASGLGDIERARVLCQVLRDEGLGLLRWSDDATAWRARAQCLHIWRGEPWPNFADEALLALAERWLTPWLDGVNTRSDFARLDARQLLGALLTPEQTRLMESLVPTHVVVPSGSRIRLSYSMDGAAPVLAVKLQEMFGLADTPAMNEGRNKVMLHLLSPAQRPIQVTQDLRSFWANTYPAVRKELRGRYNKHPWPEDPWNALPTRRTVGR
jgi:ATP-dependent helicase HrpB